jgi:hypothetical protein
MATTAPQLAAARPRPTAYQRQPARQAAALRELAQGRPYGFVPGEPKIGEGHHVAEQVMRMPKRELHWRSALERATKNQGQPLDNQVLSRLAASHHGFGGHLPAVRVHTDASADEAADRLSARAFTVGSHIFFRHGEYLPAGLEGTRMLAHELTHVAQDPATSVSDAWKLPLSSPAEPSEQAASDVARAFPVVTSHHEGLAAKPAIRRVLAAYSSSHSEILPSMGESASVTSVTSTADSPRIRAALSSLITAGKVEVAPLGDRDFYSLPANGAATATEVQAAFLSAGFLLQAPSLTAALMDRHNAKLFTGEELYELHGLWSQTLSRNRNVISQTDRPLTSEETAEARLVFGQGLNYSAIRITEDPILGAGDIARTLPSGINFPVGASSDTAYMPWLIHELTHSWQYQHGRSVVATAAWAIWCTVGAGSYSYGGKPALVAAAAAGHGLSSFNTEQQGEIAMNYYEDLKSGASVSEYAPFLAEFRRP